MAEGYIPYDSVKTVALTFNDTDGVSTTLYLSRCKRIIYVYATEGASKRKISASWTNIGTVDSDFRPDSLRFCPLVLPDNVSMMVRIYANGDIDILGTGNSVWFQSSSMYMV